MRTRCPQIETRRLALENRSLAKALALIEALASSPRPLTAVQLSQP